MNEPPTESGGEEKMECFGNPVFSWVATFREYSKCIRRCAIVMDEKSIQVMILITLLNSFHSFHF